jgi:hypothetical protein
LRDKLKVIECRKFLISSKQLLFGLMIEYGCPALGLGCLILGAEHGLHFGRI